MAREVTGPTVPTDVVPEAPVNGANRTADEETSEPMVIYTQGGHVLSLRSQQKIVRQMGAEFKQPPTFILTIGGRRGGLGINITMSAEEVDDLQAAVRFYMKGRGMQPNG